MSLLSAVAFVRKVSIFKNETPEKEATLKRIEAGLKEGKRILNGSSKALTEEEFKAAIRS